MATANSPSHHIFHNKRSIHGHGEELEAVCCMNNIPETKQRFHNNEVIRKSSQFRFP